MTDIKPRLMTQFAPWPVALEEAVAELKYIPGWRFWLSEEKRGQDCEGLTFNIVPNKPDSYDHRKHANTRFLYPVPAAAFNRESWEEWLWARIEETEGHERAEFFKFVDKDGNERRPFKPLHADGWDPGFIRRVVTAEEADIPNAGRVVKFPCRACSHHHDGQMGEHFTVAVDRGCEEPDCPCGKKVGARQPDEEHGEAHISIDGMPIVVARGDYTGLDIRCFLHPRIPKERDLFLKSPVKTIWDMFVLYDESIHITDGLEFYTLPREESNNG